MAETYLYRQIAEQIRNQILNGQLHPGDRLSAIRTLAKEWDCTPATVQKAYRDLARSGLVVSRAGQGTHVIQDGELKHPLQKAALVNRMEAFLLEVLTEGHSIPDVEQAMRLATDRWRVLAQEPQSHEPDTIVFVGSHDPALTWIASQFGQIAPGYQLSVTFAGSRGGMIALANGSAILAGSHLWDEETQTYNIPYIKKILPGQNMVLLTLVERHLGLIVKSGNPAGIDGLDDLCRSELVFINRKQGSGTRIWLDAQLRLKGILAQSIQGFDSEADTHHEVARQVAEGKADVGLGIETAAISFDLDFIQLTKERYDLIIPTDSWDLEPVQRLVSWLQREEVKQEILALGGYDVTLTGTVNWVD